MSGRQSKVCNVEFVCEFGLFISLLSGTLVLHQHWEKKKEEKSHDSAVNSVMVELNVFIF